MSRNEFKSLIKKVGLTNNFVGDKECDIIFNLSKQSYRNELD